VVQNGDVSMFDLDHEMTEMDVETGNGDENENGRSLREFAPTLTFSGHEDAVGSVSFHPLHPLLLSVSGSRHFALPSSSPSARTPSSATSFTDSEDDSEDDSDEGCTEMNGITRARRRPTPFALDASVKMWHFK